MSRKTKIEWTNNGATWNPVTGCSKVSPGCDHCYAEVMSRRLAHHPRYQDVTEIAGGWSGAVKCWPELINEPLLWKKPTTVFVCSMSDLFHDKVPWRFICQVFEVMGQCKQHTFQVLTKRPGRMDYFAEHIWEDYTVENDLSSHIWPSNVWAGTSVESQKYAPRLDCLARVPAKVRFVSVEPMLGAVDLTWWLRTIDRDDPGDRAYWLKDPLAATLKELGAREGTLFGGRRLLDWVICGGESGSRARPMHPDWVRSIRDQCVSAGVPFFYKQAMLDGKKVSLPLLDGKQWKEMP